MNIKDFSDSLDYMAKAELTPFIWGHAGIGKSSIVKQWTQQKGYHFFPFYLGTQSDIGDILGLADFVRDKNGTAVATTFATPKWLHDTIKYCEENPDSGAVIFLDEFNRARRDILNGMFSLALDKTFHTLKLPKNCYVIAAGNPPTDEYVTTDVDETALMARFVHIKLEPSVEEWVNFAKATNIDSTIIEFIRQQPELLEEKRSAFNLPVKADRRAWERLERLFKLDTPKHLMDHLMPGIIGLERTVAYQQFLKSQDTPLSAQDILKGKRLDMLAKWCTAEDTLSSFINLSCENLSNEFKSRDPVEETGEVKTLKPKEKDNVLKFLMSIPKDSAFKTLEELVRMNCRSFKDFVETQDYESQLLTIVKIAKGLANE